VRTLSDKAIQFRTYPVIPRKRIKYDTETPVEFTEFESTVPAFKCQGGYFSYNTYRLLDYFTSYWFEIASRCWTEEYGGNIPKAHSGNDLEKMKTLSPLFGDCSVDSANLTSDFIGLVHSYREYAIIDTISDRQLRKHPSLHGITSAGLFQIIDRTSKAKLKMNYPTRMIQSRGRRKFLGWDNWTNLKDTAPWTKIFNYRLVGEIKGADGRVMERVYKFVFNTPLGIAMIHNAICCGTWSINPNLYQVSGDAQLLYRYLVITGSRGKNHRVDYIGHRLGWREKNVRRLTASVESLFTELLKADLIVGFEKSTGSRGSCLFHYDIGKKKRSGKRQVRKGK
jgi:hypothetical protein